MDRRVRKLDFFSVYAMATTKEAFEDSKINLETVNLDRAGVVWGQELEE